MTRPSPDRLFRAFADETRLRILSLLAHRKELCVCDIMAILRRPQSLVSRHLAYLKGAGLAVGRRQGLWSYYSLARPEGRLHRRLIGCLRECIDGVPGMREDMRRLGKMDALGLNCR